ncbi:MAG: sodium:calcium antiporter, partial [Pseudomonadota bacterium]
MQEIAFIWASLFACLAVIGVAGVRLSRYGDIIAEKSGLSRGWVGLILLATVTSLPEVIAAGTSVWIGNTDMAFAAIFGSCSFNVTIIVLLDAMLGRGSVLRVAGPGHILTSSLGIVLIALAVFGIVLVEKFSADELVAQSVESIVAGLILVTYLACLRMTFRHERFQRLAGVAEPAPPRPVATRNRGLFA